MFDSKTYFNSSALIDYLFSKASSIDLFRTVWALLSFTSKSWVINPANFKATVFTGLTDPVVIALIKS